MRYGSAAFSTDWHAPSPTGPDLPALVTTPAGCTRRPACTKQVCSAVSDDSVVALVQDKHASLLVYACTCHEWQGALTALPIKLPGAAKTGADAALLTWTA